jgi:N-formylglutamate amidohydrolase
MTMRVGDESADSVWHVQLGEGPLVATAVHDGYGLRPEVASLMALTEEARLREEDPFTGEWTEVAPTRVIGLRSRFEVDLNRPRERAVYRRPEDAWGLEVWKREPSDDLVERSLAEYDGFYEAMHTLLEGVARRHGRFVVLDLHSYNHRRGGPDGPPADPADNPQVNIGTGTMDRARWAPVVDSFIEALREARFPGGRLDVRENVKFYGGHWPQWIHETFPESGVAIAVEFKKFFMDEWTGQPHDEMIDGIKTALRVAAGSTLAALERL